MPLQVTSSTAAEFIAAGNVPEAGAFISEVLKELGVLSDRSPPPLIMIDSQPVLQGIRRGWAPYDPLYWTMTKTARMRMCQLSQLAKSNSMVFEYCKTCDNKADGMTKIFDTEKMKTMWTQLGMSTNFKTPNDEGNGTPSP